MTDDVGLWEHALYDVPRIDHGYCTDDNARALVIVSRQPDPTPDLVDLATVYLRFVEDAAMPHGVFRNRRRPDGTWADGGGSDDSRGRALWGLGTAAHLAPESRMQSEALELFVQQTEFDSSSPRAIAFALLGAADVEIAAPGLQETRRAMRRWSIRLTRSEEDSWPWPERRLAYDNARIPEGLLAAGVSLGDDRLVESGLRLLGWLVGVESREGHFSYAPVGGWAPGEPRPGFDQQPVETAAMADACSRAWSITGDEVWRDRTMMAARWLMGENDGERALYDVASGGCCDGLTRTGVNLNQGAESTVSALIALQQAARLN
jgi:hypothetical protein